METYVETQRREYAYGDIRMSTTASDDIGIYNLGTLEAWPRTIRSISNLKQSILPSFYLCRFAEQGHNLATLLATHLPLQCGILCVQCVEAHMIDDLQCVFRV